MDAETNIRSSKQRGPFVRVPIIPIKLVWDCCRAPYVWKAPYDASFFARHKQRMDVGYAQEGFWLDNENALTKKDPFSTYYPDSPHLENHSTPSSFPMTVSLHNIFVNMCCCYAALPFLLCKAVPSCPRITRQGPEPKPPKPCEPLALSQSLEQ